MVSFAQKHLLFCLYLLDLLHQPADWPVRVGITTVQKVRGGVCREHTAHLRRMCYVSLIYRMRTFGLVTMAAFEPQFSSFASSRDGRAC